MKHWIRKLKILFVDIHFFWQSIKFFRSVRKRVLNFKRLYFSNAHWFSGNRENLRVKICILCEDLVFSPRGYFSTTVASFAKLFLQKAFLLLPLGSTIKHTLSTFSTIENKCWVFSRCSILLVLNIIKQERMRKNFISKVVLLMWEKTICWSEKFLFKLKTEKCWLTQTWEWFADFCAPILSDYVLYYLFAVSEKNIKIVIFDRKNLIRNLCCGQPGFSISENS